MAWLLFAVLANFLLGVESILDQILRKKHIRHDASITVIWIFFYFILWLAVVPFIDISIPAAPQLLAVLASGFIIVFVALPYFWSISSEEISRIMPVWQFSSVYVLLMAFFFLGETLSRADLYAFALLFAAGMTLAFEKAGARFVLNRRVLGVFAASAAWAVSLVLMKFFYLTEPFWNGFFWSMAGQLIGVAVLVLLPGNAAHLVAGLKSVRRSTALIFFAATLAALLAELAYLFAIKSGPVSLVSAVGSTGMVFLFLIAVLLSKFVPNVLKERLDRKTLLTKGIAIVLMVAGLVLLGGGL
ncbi:hypothetical protein HYX10_06315 [Candidatus Woesearchaeota archaeon]|nr:hypothetical protein [Candidatus Woesearchaeota archaeon]